MSTNILSYTEAAKDTKGHARTDRTHLFVCSKGGSVWISRALASHSMAQFEHLPPFEPRTRMKSTKFCQFLCCTTMRMINLSLLQTNIKYATWRAGWKYLEWAQWSYQPNRHKSRQWQWRRTEKDRLNNI